MGIPKGNPGEWLCKRLKPGDVVIDVGANTGKVSEELAKAVGPTGRVIACEPDPRCATELERFKSPVVAMRVAIGEWDGARKFYQSRHSVQSSLHRGAVDDNHFVGETEVYSQTLDSLAPDSVTAIKVDVQGGEAGVLAGSWRLLQTCPTWVLELWPHGLKAAGSSVRAIVDRMQGAGYSMLALDDTPLTREQLITFEQEAHEMSFINVAFVK